MNDATTRKELKIEDLPAAPQELTPEQAEQAEGGIFPYVEQDNLKSSTSGITDGTSNTRHPGGVNVLMGDGSVRF
jgi:prepilin-type processing-associated H-X9-DG protein